MTSDMEPVDPGMHTTDIDSEVVTPVIVGAHRD